MDEENGSVKNVNIVKKVILYNRSMATGQIPTHWHLGQVGLGRVLPEGDL